MRNGKRAVDLNRKGMRLIRIGVTLAVLTLAVLYSLSWRTEATRFVEHAQIVPSALGVSLGAILFWGCITVVFGRIYCSSACPVGTVQDILIWVSRKTIRRRIKFRYDGSKRVPFEPVLLYLLSLIFSVHFMIFVLEPWAMWSNIVAIWHPAPWRSVVLDLGLGSFVGLLSGICSMVMVGFFALFRGRAWCNEICPVGILLRLFARKSLYHIEIDRDKCVSCMACERNCKAECIKVAERKVDNNRCVRCFTCISQCENDAIHYQSGNNRASTPMMDRADGGNK